MEAAVKEGTCQTRLLVHQTRSTIGGGGGGGGCNNFVPVLGGSGTKVTPTGEIFDQFPGQMS